MYRPGTDARLDWSPRVELIGDPDPVKAARTSEAMLQMRKLDLAALQRAHDGV